MVTPTHFAKILHSLGVSMPGLMGWISIVVELVGSRAVLMGVFVPLVSIPLAAILFVSVFTLLLPYGFQSIKPQGVTSTGIRLGTSGYEVDLPVSCLSSGFDSWRHRATFA
jgi:putative oxidoreductase